MNKELEKYTYNFFKNYYMKDIISHSKYCVFSEEKNKINIFFSRKALKKIKKDSNGLYNINCIKNESANDILRKYNLNKPVYYIFDGFTFNDYLVISSNCNIIIKNCVFNSGLEINTSKNVLLEHNTYNDNRNNNQSINMLCKCNDLSIKNDNNYFNNISIDANKVNILNSRLVSCITLNTMELSLIQSEINSNSNVYIDSDELFSSNGLIKAKEGIIIEDKESYMSKNFTFNCVLNAPIVIYNNVYLTDEKRYTSINYDKIKINKLRQDFINILKNIRDECIVANNKRIEDIQNKLSEKAISKVLK